MSIFQSKYGRTSKSHNKHKLIFMLVEVGKHEHFIHIEYNFTFSVELAEASVSLPTPLSVRSTSCLFVSSYNQHTRPCTFVACQCVNPNQCVNRAVSNQYVNPTVLMCQPWTNVSTQPCQCVNPYWYKKNDLERKNEGL